MVVASPSFLIHTNKHNPTLYERKVHVRGKMQLRYYFLENKSILT